MKPAAPHTLAIIGGGFTGAAIAYHLARTVPKYAVDIRVIEPRELIGPGLAYSTTDPAHRVNVPAQRMSLDPDDPAHFECWAVARNIAKSDPKALMPDGPLFPLRRVFGHYIHEHMAPLVYAGWIKHVRDRVARVSRLGDVFDLRLSSGQRILAQTVVVATSHPPPQIPRPLASWAGHARFIADPGRSLALKSIARDHHVLIIGTGLTMADIVASLKHSGHRGPITAVSRRGLLSRGHPLAAQPNFGDFTTAPRQSVRDLVRDIRLTIEEAEKQGLSWHAVFDALRAQGAVIWKALPLEEQRGLVRHLRAYWDAHRFRIAPQIQMVLDRARADGSLEVLSGSLLSGRKEDDAFIVDIKPKRQDASLRIACDAIVIATGPSHRTILETATFMRDLAAHGWAQLDEVGLGLKVDPEFRAIGKSGEVCDGLLIAGPLARGTFGELMGLPEIARHSVAVAGRIASRLNRSSHDYDAAPIHVRRFAKTATR